MTHKTRSKVMNTKAVQTFIVNNSKKSNEEIVLCQEKISNEDFVRIQKLSINSKCNISSELCKFRKYFFEHPPGKLLQARVVYFKFNMKQK